VTLPADGRPAAAPPWPLPDVTGREAELWQALWVKPQAVEWARMGLDLEVALYVRRFAEAELPGALVTLSTLVRQMADALGLSAPGLRANRWRIEAPAERAQRTPSEGARRSARDRLRVLDGPLDAG
jgi:hypothetical protein